MGKRQDRTTLTRRRPGQGIRQIVRFNPEFYLLAGAVILISSATAYLTEGMWQTAGVFVCMVTLLPTLTSLVVSWWIYDLSDLYAFREIADNRAGDLRIVNIHAGFDETSEILRRKFPAARFTVFDFYDPAVHTEPSVRRARAVYPPYSGTRIVKTAEIPLPTATVDKIFLIFAAHEIRDKGERVAFFRETARILRPDGEVYVIEHLRDVPNFLAYSAGFLHFIGRREWMRTFAAAQLKVLRETKKTPFVTIFNLNKNGSSS